MLWPFLYSCLAWPDSFGAGVPSLFLRSFVACSSLSPRDAPLIPVPAPRKQNVPGSREPGTPKQAYRFCFISGNLAAPPRRGPWLCVAAFRTGLLLSCWTLLRFYSSILIAALEHWPIDNRHRYSCQISSTMPITRVSCSLTVIGRLELVVGRLLTFSTVGLSCNSPGD